jgi:lipoate---protein ligase
VRVSAQRKVRGGKLLRVHLELEGGVVTAAEISGDFFLYPEDGLGALESALVGISSGTNEDSIQVLVQKLFISNDLTSLGFGPPDLARTIWEALR